MLKAGIYKEKITPDTTLAGSFRRHWTKKPHGVHDDLFATALYLSDGGSQLLLISLDILSLTNEIAANIKAEISRQAKVPAAGIMIACIHSHNSLDPLNEDNMRDDKIIEDLSMQVVRCAKNAVAAAEDAKIGFGDTCIAIGRNRCATKWKDDLCMGAIDPVCDIIKIENTDGKIIGIFFHYSSHPTAAMDCDYALSRDCIGYAVDALEQQFDCKAGFFQGAAGNTNFKLGERSFAHAQRIGNSVAEFVSARIPSIECAADIKVSAREQVLRLEKRTDYTFNIDEVNQNIAEAQKKFDTLVANSDDETAICGAFGRLKVLNWQKTFYDSNQLESCVEALIQAIKIGDVEIITVPGEIFVEYQLAFRAHNFPHRAMIFGYANGYIGYIPTQDAVKHGGYGAEPSFVQQVYATGGEQMLDAGIEMLKTL